MNTDFWLFQLTCVFVHFTIAYCNGLLVRHKNVKVNYTRKINHFFLFFLPVFLNSIFVYEKTLQSTIVGIFVMTFTLIIYIKPLRTRLPLIGTAFLSFDQQLGDIFGAFIRFGWQDDAADIDYNALYSGGVNITGKWYGREQDNFGIGYAYLNGENDFDYTQVAEIYWRMVFNDYFAATADFQYMEDKFDSDKDDIEGVIGGIRVTAEF